MRILIQSSIILFIFLQASISLKASPIDSLRVKYLPAWETVKYRTMIDVMGKHLSGILFLKNIEGQSTRCVFMNEMGVTFFDLNFENNQYHYESIMSSLNKKGVKITLAKDLGMILMDGIFQTVISENKTENKTILKLKLKRKGFVTFHIDSTKQQIPFVENKNKRNKTFITVQQLYLSNNTMPDSIFVKHHQINFQISLKQIHASE
ncbi:MAG TPA: hypothetical protein PKA54_10110 [Chitinophagaceae bacterium]|nr:hypothetical protein [Chitinophagaceae bacterium]